MRSLPHHGRQRLKVGLLGGSFNPAHAGHRHISVEALRRLGLDQVWWLVSPQNPLKPRAGMAPLAERLATARLVARHPAIVPTAIEQDLGTRYTVDTLAALRRRFPLIRFAWLMGADNLVQIGRWKRWQRLFEGTAIAVFDRPRYAAPALASMAAQRFRARRRPETSSRRLCETRPPAWIFIRAPLHPASATAIREKTARARRLLERGVPDRSTVAGRLVESGRPEQKETGP